MPLCSIRMAAGFNFAFRDGMLHDFVTVRRAGSYGADVGSGRDWRVAGQGAAAGPPWHPCVRVRAGFRERPLTGSQGRRCGGGAATAALPDPADPGGAATAHRPDGGLRDFMEQSPDVASCRVTEPCDLRDSRNFSRILTSFRSCAPARRPWFGGHLDSSGNSWKKIRCACSGTRKSIYGV